MPEYNRYLPNRERQQIEKQKFVFTDISDIQEQMAQDASLAQFNEKPESDVPKGWRKWFSGKFWKGLGRSIWKQNLARDYYEVSGKKKAEAQMEASGSLFAAEKKFDPNEKGIDEAEKQRRIDAQKNAHQQYVGAIIQRFAAAQGELVNDLIHSQIGEKIDTLGDGRAERRIKSRLQAAVKAYAAGNIGETELLREEAEIWAEMRSVKPAVLDKGRMYASNLLQVAKWARSEVARQVAQNIDHNRAVMGLQLDFDVVVGKAKSGAKTEAQFNSVERVVDKIQAKTRGVFGFAFNETAITAIVSAAYFVKKSLFTRGLSSAAGVAGIAVGAGATAAFREGKVLERERMQHAREMAQGRKFDESSATRRRELEQFRLQFKTAKELKANLKNTLFDWLDSGRGIEDLSVGEYNQALAAVAEIDSRILEGERGIVTRKRKWWKFWRKEYKEERHKADLIGYSDPTKIAEEEWQLDVARAAAKVLLKKWALAHGKTEAQFKADLQSAVEGKITSFYQGEQGINQLNERFKKFKHKKMWQVGKRAALWGAIFGTAIQEASAFGQEQTYGVLEHGWDAVRGQHHTFAPGEHTTMLESGLQRIKKGWDYLFPTAHVAGPPVEVQFNATKYKLNGGLRLEDNPATPDPNDRVLVDTAGNRHALQFNADGTPTPATKDWLAKNGYTVNESLTPGSARGIHSLDEAATRKQYPELSEHTRVDWHDEPGEFWSEIHKQFLEFEGKQQIGYLVAEGDKVYLDCSKVINNFLKEIQERVNSPDFGQVEGYFNADGTPFVDPKMMHLKEQIIKAINNGDILKKFQAVVIPTEGANQAGLSDLIEGVDARGLIELKGKYDWSKLFIDPTTGQVNPEMLRDGHLPFKYLEMRFDGHVMNTIRGAAEEVVGTPVVEITPPPTTELPPIVWPPWAYVRRRRGLEGTDWRQGEVPVPPPPVVPYVPYGYGYESEAQRREREEWYRGRISPTLRNNPQALLDFQHEANWYFVEQAGKRPEYVQDLAEILQQPGMREPMSDTCRIAVCIPVYDLGEGKIIEHTLEQYRKQIDNGSIKAEEFELILFLNHPRDKKDTLNILPGAEARVRNGMPEAYDTEEVIKQYQQKHPEIKIRVMKKEFEQRPKWGWIIKYLYDAACRRALERSNPVNKDIIILTNDADVRDMSDSYLKNIITAIDKNEDEARAGRAVRVDGVVGRIDLDPQAYKKWPTFFSAMRFFQFFDAQGRYGYRGEGKAPSLDMYSDNNVQSFTGRYRKKGEPYIVTQGRNTALRGSTYCAIGGANLDTDAGADTELGDMVRIVRRGRESVLKVDRNPFKYVNPAWLETNPRRELDTYKSGRPITATWQGWSKMDVYGRSFEKEIEGDSEDLDPKRLEWELNHLIHDWFRVPANSPAVKRALHWIGLKDNDYSIEGDEIKIKNISGIINREIVLRDGRTITLGIANWKSKRERLQAAEQKRRERQQASMPVQTSAEAPASERLNLQEAQKILDESKTQFEQNPFNFIYGDGLNVVNRPGLGINRFIRDLRLHYGISNAEYTMIQERAKQMKRITGRKREIAQLVRVVMVKNPAIRADWQHSGDAGSYERLVRDLVSAEAKQSVAQKNFDLQGIDRLSQEFGLHPAIILDAILSSHPPLQREALRQFKAAVQGDRFVDNQDNRARVYREVLEEFQKGELQLQNRQQRSSGGRRLRTI